MGWRLSSSVRAGGLRHRMNGLKKKFSNYDRREDTVCGER
jgi:hypothetical protein